jgi:hypothetical protein
MHNNAPNEAESSMPDWLREAWPRVSTLLAISIAHQQPEDRTKIHRALDEGHPIDFMLERDRVVFGVGGMAFCELTMAAITGIPAGSARH